MKIINQSKNTILATEAVVADKALSRIKGLLGRKELRAGEALIIKPCNSIHTFFMRFPIDVLFVDKHSKAIKAIHSILPFHLTAIYFTAAFAIELPVGSLAASFTEPGDTILLE